MIHEWMSHLPDTFKNITDYVSLGVVVGYFSDLLPLISIFMTSVWTFIRIYETQTVQKMLPCNRNKKMEKEDEN